MSRLRGSNLNWGSCYTGYESRRCLIYVTATSLNELNLYLYGAERDQRYEMPLHDEKGLDEDLEENFKIDGEQTCVCSDSEIIIKP